MTRIICNGLLAEFVAMEAATTQALAQQQQKKPTILVIMGDDVGWFNIGAYHRGIMSGKTPNLDKLASEGMMFSLKHQSRFVPTSSPSPVNKFLRPARPAAAQLSRSAVSTVMLAPDTRETQVHSLAFSAFSSSLKKTSR